MKNSFPLQFLAIALSLGLLVPPIDAHEPVFARKGMVVAQEPLAADVGVAVLKSGGNLIAISPVLQGLCSSGVDFVSCDPIYRALGQE